MLEAQGYACIRSSASHSPFDIVAFSYNDILLVQVKSERKPSETYLRELREFPSPEGVKKQLWIWKQYKRLPEVIDL
jgi:hypothetical protein